MRIIKGIKVIVFVFLFIVINLLLSYLLVKANGPSEVMWKDFRKNRYRIFRFFFFTDDVQSLYYR